MGQMVLALFLALISVPAQAAEASAILRGTPWWVFALFAVLIYLGLRAARPRVSGWPRAVLNAGIFMIWGIAALLIRSGPPHALVWTLTASAGGALALLTVGFNEMEVDRRQGLVRLPASWLPLARNMLVFGAKYAIAILTALATQAQGQLALWDLGISGASAGYFAAWLWRFWLAYRGAPSVAIEVPAPAAEAQGRL
jgi:hypothetical protein